MPKVRTFGLLLFLIIFYLVGCAGIVGPESQGQLVKQSQPTNLIVVPPKAAPGAKVDILGSGFSPDSVITVQLVAEFKGAGKVKTLLGAYVDKEENIIEVKANSFGSFKITATVPGEIAEGIFRIDAEDQKGNEANAPIEVRKAEIKK